MLHSNATFLHVLIWFVIITTGAAGRAELMVAADIPPCEITMTACAIKSRARPLLAFAMASHIGTGNMSEVVNPELYSPCFHR